MSYEPKIWECGDTITAEDLNHIEQGIKSATGYECVETTEPIFDGSVTTQESYGTNMAQLTDDSQTVPGTLKITIDGTEYVCDKQDGYMNTPTYGSDGDIGYPTPSFSEYPFLVQIFDNGMRIFIQTAGTYQIKVDMFVEGVNVTECFEKAVTAVDKVFYVTATESYGSISDIDKTKEEIEEAILSGKVVIGKINEHDDDFTLLGANWHYVQGVRQLETVSFGSVNVSDGVLFGWGALFGGSTPIYRMIRINNQSS